MNTLILTIILIPLIEIYLFIEIGGQIGAGYTILFILLTAVIGLYFAKLEGINTIRSGMNQLTNNQMPIYEMISGAALAFAAVLLIIPGFATDIIGFLLIIPFTRNLLFEFITKKYEKTKVSGEDDLIEGEYEDKDKIKNDLIITKNKKTYLVEGNNFSLNSIINDTLTGDKKKNVKFFDNQTRHFNVKFGQNDIDKDHVINDLSGEIILIGSKINSLSLNSKFKKNQKVSLSILTKNNEQVTTFYSDFAKPFVKKFNFIKGFEEGKINFSSSKINNTSSSQLNIYDFKLKELPALTKLLTLASLQGIADILTGEGVRFNEFEMIFTNKDDKMTIDEIYSIGPAISILMEGYVQKNKLVSLKGTLVPATTINKFVSSIPILGNILVGKKTGEGVFGVSFKIKGPPKNLKTTVNPIKTLTPRFITRTLEKIKN